MTNYIDFTLVKNLQFLKQLKIYMTMMRTLYKYLYHLQ